MHRVAGIDAAPANTKALAAVGDQGFE